MTDSLPAGLARAVEELVAALADRRFEIFARDQATSVLPQDLERRLSEYGRTLIPLPSGWERDAHVYASRGEEGCAVDVDLWTVEEGRSNLTLQLEARRTATGWSLTVLDLRVL